MEVIADSITDEIVYQTTMEPELSVLLKDTYTDQMALL